jgi:predicted RNA binding protein YcfA (HicA-like mRNA interferase family)
MHHKFDKAKKPLTIPRHKELGKGLIRKLVRDAEISIGDLIGLL